MVFCSSQWVPYPILRMFQPLVQLSYSRGGLSTGVLTPGVYLLLCVRAHSYKLSQVASCPQRNGIPQLANTSTLIPALPALLQSLQLAPAGSIEQPPTSIHAIWAEIGRKLPASWLHHGWVTTCGLVGLGSWTVSIENNREIEHALKTNKNAMFNTWEICTECFQTHVICRVHIMAVFCVSLCVLVLKKCKESFSRIGCTHFICISRSGLINQRQLYLVVGDILVNWYIQ